MNQKTCQRMVCKLSCAKHPLRCPVQSRPFQSPFLCSTEQRVEEGPGSCISTATLSELNDGISLNTLCTLLKYCVVPSISHASIQKDVVKTVGTTLGLAYRFPISTELYSGLEGKSGSKGQTSERCLRYNELPRAPSHPLQCLASP